MHIDTFNNLDETFNRLKQISFESMLNILCRNGVMFFDYASGAIKPYQLIAAEFEQLCFENGWTTESFLSEYF